MADWGPVAALTEREAADADTAMLSGYCRDIAAALRAPGAILDRDPDAITDYLDLPAVALQRQVLMPAEYRTGGDTRLARAAVRGVLRVLGARWRAPGLRRRRDASGQPGTVAVQRRGPRIGRRGAAGVVLRSAGRASAVDIPRVDRAGQGFGRDRAGDHLGARPGRRRLAAHGREDVHWQRRRAQLGVVFCRRAPGPWGIEAVLVDTADPGFRPSCCRPWGCAGPGSAGCASTGCTSRPSGCWAPDGRAAAGACMARARRCCGSGPASPRSRSGSSMPPATTCLSSGRVCAGRTGGDSTTSSTGRCGYAG